MTRRKHSARGLTMAQSAFCDVPDDVATSRKPASPWQTRHGAVGGNFELRAVKEVQEIFRGIVDDDTILGVLETCNYDSEKATTLLCEITSAKPPMGVEQDSVYQPAHSNRKNCAEEYNGPCIWEFLPMECKLQVIPLPCDPGCAQPTLHFLPLQYWMLFCTSFSLRLQLHMVRCLQVWENLSLKDMARAAGTCKDFAMHAKETRSELRTLKLPAGVFAFIM